MAEDVLQRLNAIPGVEMSAFTALLPLEGTFNSLPIVVASRPLNGPSHGSSRWMIVSPAYFEALKIPLIRGRFFTERDGRDAPGVAIINEAMARQFWPAGDALGAQLFIGKGLGPAFEEPAREVIGIVGDVHEDALDREAPPAIFVPAAQPRRTAPAILGGPGDPKSARTMWVVARTRTDSPSLYSAIQEQLRQAAGGMPVQPVRSMEQIAAQSTGRQQFNMTLMSVFAGAALLLAAIGIYGLISYGVQQRKQEIGIRMALGAESNEVRRAVVFQGMRLVLAGIAIGLVAGFGLTRFMKSFLFRVQALDSGVFVTVPLVLIAVALCAVWLPASRASRIDPIEALRHE
jgi:predicted permease